MSCKLILSYSASVGIFPEDAHPSKINPVKRLVVITNEDRKFFMFIIFLLKICFPDIVLTRTFTECKCVFFLLGTKSF